MHALIKGTIYVSPDVEPIRDGAVLIGGDKIMAVGRGVKVPTTSEVIDCSGRTITAGFWNSHVHFFERKWANVAAIPAETIRAAVDETHRAGRPVFLHPGTGEHVLTAIRSGVDVIAHTTPHSGPWDEEILAAAKERRTALTPPLAVWKYHARHDRLSTQEKTTNAAIDQLRKWIGAGATVLFGTDLGAVEYDPTEEYVLMSQAGMTFPDILASLTTTPAGFFGESKSGRIAEGFEADLVVLDGDPSKDIRALAAVRHTLTRGKYAPQNLSRG